MKSNPKERDVKAPPRVVVWRAYKNRQGKEQPITPDWATVLLPAALARNPRIYALLCECDEELRTQQTERLHGKLNSGGLVNYKSDNQMGGRKSQVTAVKVKDSGEKVRRAAARRLFYSLCRFSVRRGVGDIDEITPTISMNSRKRGSVFALESC